MVDWISKVRMADISSKGETLRIAEAVGELKLTSHTLDLIRRGKTVKGDPFPVAEAAAVMAAKNTPQIIPFCHPIPLTGVVTKSTIIDDHIKVRVQVKSRGRTGVEMEALTAAAAYLLSLWDMVKAHEKDSGGGYPNTAIESIKVVRKVKMKEE